ncbi:MAG: hypothetical protein MMC23_004578 [Stictis urceolatum]|nr:hypothetical protein [Stictis urceolata]
MDKMKQYLYTTDSSPGDTGSEGTDGDHLSILMKVHQLHLQQAEEKKLESKASTIYLVDSYWKSVE